MDISDAQDRGSDSAKSRSSSFSVMSASDVVEADIQHQPPEQPLKSVQELQNWLEPTQYLSPGNEYMKHVAAYVPGTGDWLRKTDEFCHWMDESDDKHGRCLWIKGVPGTGKSVVAASVAQSLLENGIPVLFFFFRQIVNTNHTPTYLVRDWCAQLLPHNLAFRRELSDLSRRQELTGIEMTLLWEALCRALRGMQRVFCIADALDEMDESHWDDFLPLLSSLPIESRGVKLLLTSRPIPRLETILHHTDISRVRLEATLIYPDIVTYTNVRLLSLPENARLSTETEDKVRDTICERTNGLFLHARLMIDNLTSGLIEGTITDGNLPDSLERLPRNLRELYTTMLDEHSRRSGITKEQQFKILTCVISSSRPLRLIEIASMVCWMRNEKPDEALKKYKELVRASCGRLLEILEDETVSVIHHSFTEFLRDENRSDAEFPVVKAVESQKILALLCLEYLSACVLPVPVLSIFRKCKEPAKAKAASVRARKDRGVDSDDASITKADTPGCDAGQMLQASEVGLDEESRSDDEDESNREEQDETDYVRGGVEELRANTKQAMLTTLRLEYPLMEYAVTNLVHHIRLANPKQELDGETAAALDSLFKPGATAFIIYLLRHWRSNAFTQVTALHIAVTMPLEAYVIHLLESGADVDAPDNDGRCALLLTCDGSCEDSEAATRLARILINAGADPDMPDQTGEKPLHYAAAKNMPSIVRLLLDTGVSPITPRTRDDAYVMEHFYKSTKGDTPLLSSARNPEIMKMFLPHISHDTTLLYKVLAWTNDVRVVQEVLQLGKGRLDINMVLRGMTLLYVAAHQQNLEMVKFLLEHGADPNVLSDDPDYYGYTINAEHVSIVAAKDDNNGATALHAWADTRDAARGATEEDIAQIFKLLIEAGADVNSGTAEGRTPLLDAVQEPSCWWDSPTSLDETRAKILLDAGADPGARDEYGNTPLHYVQPYWKNLVKALVSKGADINGKNNGGETPLLRLFIRGPSNARRTDELITISRELLKHGADVNIRTNAGNTLGHRMIGIRIPDDEPGYIAKLLELWAVFIDAGLDLNARNKEGDTPFFLYRKNRTAKDNDDSELLQFLERAGMSLEESIEEKAKILFETVDDCSEDSGFDRLKDLVERESYPVTVRNLEKRTLLHVAVDRHLFTMVQYLIDHGADPAAIDADGNTIMHALAIAGKQPGYDERMLNILLDHDVPVNKRNGAGQLPLHLAAGSTESHSILASLLNLPDVGLNAVDDQGRTPLHYAACISDCQVAQLLKAGADPKVITNEGVSPLYVACRARESNAVGLLLSEYRRQAVLEEWINREDNIDRHTPLHVATRSGQAESVRYLLDHGANLEARDAADRTPLHAAAEILEEASLWKTTGALSGLDAAGVAVHDSRRPENWQSRRWVLEERVGSCGSVVEMLTGAGVDKEAVASDGLTALEFAMKLNNEEMVAILKGEECLSETQKPPKQAFDKIEDLFKLSETQLLRILQSGEYDVTQPLKELRDSTILHKLIDHGKTRLLAHFTAEAHRLHKLDYMFEEGNPGTLLMHTCERALPSLDILRTLIEDIGLDVNEKSNRYGYIYKISDSTPLHRLAAGTNYWNIEAVKYLIGKGSNIEARNYCGETPLAVAVSTESPDGYWKQETARILLEAGANPNALNERGESPLSKAFSLDLVQLLLDYGADTRIGQPVVHAVTARNVDLARKFLECGADPNVFVYGKRALHEVARPCDEPESDKSLATRRKLTQLLLQYHADPFLLYEGNTLLHWIIEEHGILDPFWGLEDLDFEKRGAGDRTLLISACMPTVPPHPRCAPVPASGSPHTALKLLSLGADVNATDATGRTALHWLCTHPEDLDTAHQAVFKALVEKSPSNIHLLDNNGLSPYHLASQHLHTWTADRLIALGVKPTMPDPDGNTALHHFAPAMFGAKDRATKAAARFKHLLGLGLEINARNKAGETPVFRFIATRLSDLPCYVIEAQNQRSEDDDPYQEDEEDLPYVLYDAEKGDVGHCTALSLLIEAGADIHTVNNKGETLLHVTAGRTTESETSNWRFGASDSHQKDDVIDTFKKLVDLGVDLTKEDARHRTAVDVAVACGNRNIVDFFAPEKRRQR